MEEVASVLGSIGLFRSAHAAKWVLASVRVSIAVVELQVYFFQNTNAWKVGPPTR